MKKKRRVISRPIGLMLCVLAMLLIHPFFEGDWFGGIVLGVLFTLMLASSVLALLEHRWMKWVVFAIGSPWIVLLWGQIFFMDIPDSLRMAGGISLLLFCGMTVVMEIIHISRASAVTRAMLYDAISCYLLLGILWAGLYELLLMVNPGALTASPDILHGKIAGTFSWLDCVYFSFTTLTTLGYGDIEPVSRFARSLVIIESVIGPLYLAVLLAKMVADFSKAKYHTKRTGKQD